MSEPEVVDLCRSIAKEAHAGLKRWGGEDYFEAHLVPVAARAREFGPIFESVAWLHDVLEDCGARSWTAGRMLSRGVPSVVVSSVELLTHAPGVSYRDYLVRILDSGNLVARTVKALDIEHNLAALPAGNVQRRDKYELALELLARRSARSAAVTLPDSTA